MNPYPGQITWSRLISCDGCGSLYAVDRMCPFKSLAGCEVCRGIEMPPEFVPVNSAGVSN